jgi:hypothetical protein
MPKPIKFDLMRANRFAADARIEEEARERSRKAIRAALMCPSWAPCNPGCAPEFGGARSQHCTCDAAKVALQQAVRA